MCPQKTRALNLQKRSCLYFKKNTDLRAHNSRILRIKNAKISGCYFKMDQNIHGIFQICINVPLSKLHDHEKATSISTRSFPLLKVIKIIFLVGVFRVFVCIRVPRCTKMTSACNTEKYNLVILFGRAKHLKVSVILFKRFRTIFDQKVKPISFFSRMKERYLYFTTEVFYIQLLKQTQNISKIVSLDRDSLADFSKILKIISECIFCWKIQNYSNQFQSVWLVFFSYLGKCNVGS